MDDDEPTPPRRSRARDFWTLDVPLVLVLTLCTVVTIIEYRRATEGIWRAWVYLFEWPMIGAFAVWMWIRFRREGGSFRGMTDRWRARVARYEAEAAAEEAAKAPAPAEPPLARPEDPERDKWEQYVADLQRRQPPGRPD